MEKLEYKSVEIHKLIKGHHLELDISKLNELGNEGWELVSVVNGNCIFKRKVTA